jgi:WD40 repeat protein
LWDAEEGALLATLEGHRGSVGSAAFSADGRWVITLSEDETARLWDATDGALLATLQDHSRWVTSGAFSPDR